MLLLWKRHEPVDEELCRRTRLMVGEQHVHDSTASTIVLFNMCQGSVAFCFAFRSRGAASKCMPADFRANSSRGYHGQRFEKAEEKGTSPRRNNRRVSHLGC